MQRLMVVTDVKVLCAVSRRVSGRMLTETGAPDRRPLEKVFKSYYVNYKWIMPIDLDARPKEPPSFDWCCYIH